MNKYAEKRLEQILSELPYYWDTNNPDSNIYKLFSVVASLIGNWEKELDEVRDSRAIDTASGISLDHVASDIGVTRDIISFISNKTSVDVKPENDEMLRNRIKWNIEVQESDGTIKDIKELVTQGLKMYRVRTGLGGMVYENDLEVESFTSKMPPEFILPDDVNITDVRYIEPKDVYIFENQETRLGMTAPDSFHGKYGDLNGFYQINIPWKALPWSEGEKSLIWRSQDTFPTPYSQSFTDTSIESNILSVEHGLDTMYNVVTVVNEAGKHIKPNNVSVSEDSTDINLSSFDIDGTWKVRVTSRDHLTKFDSSDINDDVFEFEHNIDLPCPPIEVYDENDEMVDKHIIEIYYPETGRIAINISDVTVSGEYKVVLIGGEDSTSHSTSFDESDLGD